MFHIFVSYSRRDLTIARSIVDTLAARNLDTWFDWDSIPKGEKWEQEIYRGIEEADLFLFLISPDSVRSEMCNKEILHAIQNNKRILPVLLKETGDASYREPAAMERINSLNWVFCRAGKDPFEEAIAYIQKTINTDYDWVRFHTMLQVKALAWEKSGRDHSRLLRGKELKEAEGKTIRETPRQEPALTDVQESFIRSSRLSARRRKMLPYQVFLALLGSIFLGGKFYFLYIPIPNACPQVKQASVQIERIDPIMPAEMRSTLTMLAAQSNFQTTINDCDTSAEGMVSVLAGYDAEREMIALTMRLPETPAYRMDLLPEIREFGPELVSEQETAALLQAATAYSVGEYQTAVELLKGLTSLSSLTLTAQAQLMNDDRLDSQTTYAKAVRMIPQPNETYTGKLLMGAALAWWRPESYYQLSFEGNLSDCIQAGELYAKHQEWLDSSSLAHNTRIIFAYYCVNEKDTDYEPYRAWKQETPLSEPDPTAPDAASINTLQQYILALESKASKNADPNSLKEHLLAAQDLLLARAELSEYYWGIQDNCKDAGFWRDAFQSGIFSNVEKTKLRKLLQNQPLFCR